MRSWTFWKNFFWQSSNPKTGGKIFPLCFGPRSQSIGRAGRLSWEGALDHRDSRERRDKILAAKTENANFFKKNWIRKTVFSGEFQFTNFHFFGRGKTNFFWATMITMSIDIVSLSLLSLDRLLPSESVNMFLSSSPWRTPPRLLTPPSYITPPQASLTASDQSNST